MTSLLSDLEKNYKIEAEIGRGGMGVVYSATDKRLDRKVALKVLSLSSFSSDKNVVEEVINRFHREAKSIAKLSHTNIVNVYDIGESTDSYYMVMEFLEGKSLAKIIEEHKKITPALVANIGYQICNALDYAHQNGVIHRDIKPANIILSSKGIAKLTDFGIAQLNSEQKKLTQAGSILGSIMYIPPEQLIDSAKVDQRADIYSLGVTLYELSTGFLPFDAENVSEIFTKILKEMPKAPSNINPEIPHALDHIIIKALLKSPEQRYQTAGEMAQELSQLLDLSTVSRETFVNMFFSNSSSKSEPGNNQNSSAVVSGTNPFTKTLTKKTTINQIFLGGLLKNYSWVISMFKNWKTEIITKLNINQVINKLIEPSLFGKGFTGILIIDKNIYAFVYDGNFVGALDIVNGTTGDSVFQNLPENPVSLELKVPEEENIFSPVIISCILENLGVPVHGNFDSSVVNLIPLIENIYDEKEFTGYISCYTENNIYYFGFYKGRELFCIPVNNQNNDEIDPDKKINLKEMVNRKSLIFNAYSVKPRLALPNILNHLKNSTVNLKYINNEKTKLYDIVNMENQEVPLHIIKEAKQNSVLELTLNQPGIINILDQEINLPDLIKDSVYYRFAEWLVREYFYLLNSTGNITSLKYIYSWIPAIESFNFFETLQGEDGKNYEFGIILHGQVKDENYKKVLMLVRFGNGEREDLERFLHDSIEVKKKLIKSGDIGGAIYISNSEIQSDTLKLFYERTVEPRKGFGLGSLDKLTKYKGFVRIGIGRGFHLNLIEYNKNNQSFNVIAPLLK